MEIYVKQILLFPYFLFFLFLITNQQHEDRMSNEFSFFIYIAGRWKHVEKNLSVFMERCDVPVYCRRRAEGIGYCFISVTISFKFYRAGAIMYSTII